MQFVMNKTIYIVLEQDLIFYPPVISIMNICLDLGCQVVYIGTFGDQEGQKRLENKGARFKQVVPRDMNESSIAKYLNRIKFRNKIYRYLAESNISDKDYVWIFHSYTFYLLYELVDKYNVIYHPLEFSAFKMTWKQRLLSPGLNMVEAVKKAKKVVCCEYNRAQITKGIFSLDRLPFILPNKMYLPNETLPSTAQIDEYLSLMQGKKVILYQGVFHDKERRLEEFCEAVQSLPEEYMLIAMGKGSAYYENLKKKYTSEKILFIPFIKPPYHLLITKMASIGILSYFPVSTTIYEVLNPIYCAPNKIFEYARYGVPMISNDIPGLSYIFNQYHCGRVVKDPMTPSAIKQVIEDIYADYDVYSQGALDYYNSVDVKQIVNDILTD